MSRRCRVRWLTPAPAVTLPHVSLRNRGVISLWRRTHGVITQLATRYFPVSTGTWYRVRGQPIERPGRAHHVQGDRRLRPRRGVSALVRIMYIMVNYGGLFEAVFPAVQPLDKAASRPALIRVPIAGPNPRSSIGQQSASNRATTGNGRGRWVVRDDASVERSVDRDPELFFVTLARTSACARASLSYSPSLSSAA